MAARRFGLAQQRLAQLASRFGVDDQVLLLTGECELERGHREAALEYWAKVSRQSPFFARAAMLSASQWINTGRYKSAEELLNAAVVRASAADRDELDRALSRLYRFEGRLDDVRRILRGSWWRSADPAGVLKELWLLDHSPMPVEAWQRALDAADDQDDRVWLGRANVAILTGRLPIATDWLDRALARRPDDPAVWKARLALTRASDDLDGLRVAAARLPEGELEPDAVASLRAWLADRMGDRDVERRELLALLREAPADPRALERLAVLSFQEGQSREAEQFRRQKADADRAMDRFRRILLDAGFAGHAAELARLSRVLGRSFDTAAWSLLAEEENAGQALSQAGAAGTKAQRLLTLSASVRARAVDLSAPFALGLEGPKRATGPPLADRLADLFDSGQGRTGRALAAGRAHEHSASGRPVPRFVDDAEAAGLRFTFENGQSPRHLLPETMSGGLALLDYDGDGWLDVYCVQGGSLPGETGAGTAETPTSDTGDRLFRNRGNGTFEDITKSSRIAAIAWGRGYGLGVAAGDYDNDGNTDLFVTRLDSYALYRNRGDGTFEDVTQRAGLSGRRDNPTSAALADLDNDGDLDLYVCHYMIWDPANPRLCLSDTGAYFYCDPSKVEPAPDHVFRNDGGRFVDVTATAGLSEDNGRGLGVVAADLNGDGRIDLYVANDGTANYLYRNKGRFQFEEVAMESGVAGSASGGYQAGMGVACGDLDLDGLPDLLVTNFYGEGTTLYQNLGQGLFADRSSASGIGLATRHLLGFGIALLDVSNRGRPDVLVTNGHVNDNRPYYPYAMPARLYENRADGRLMDISSQTGPPFDVPRVGRGLAAGDLDNDGRCDVVILAQNEPLAYFHNRTEHAGHFVTLRLEGSHSNRDAIGARVVVTSAGGPQVAQRFGGGSYQSASDLRLHFGLGESSRIESVEVHWPAGGTDRWTKLGADAGYRLREGDPKPHPLAGFIARRTKTP
jgi:tetratricopeptide (TPR) repeat protein